MSFVASDGTGKVHAEWCEWGGRISPHVRRNFTSLKDAVRERFVPAGCCLEFTARDMRHFEMRNA